MVKCSRDHVVYGMYKLKKYTKTETDVCDEAQRIKDAIKRSVRGFHRSALTVSSEYEVVVERRNRRARLTKWSHVVARQCNASIVPRR